MNVSKRMRTILSAILTLVLLAGLGTPALAAESAVGSTLRLVETSGTVTVKNASGKKQTVRQDMRLYSGYSVETAKSSSAYISLDSEKVVKLDASTQVEVQKSGKKLEVTLTKGKLFFNVTQPLKADETLNICSATMVTGIRGSFGWVTPTEVGLMHGHVTVTCRNPETGEKRVTELYSGQGVRYDPYDKNSAGADPQLFQIDFIKRTLTNDWVPRIVRQEMKKDNTLRRLVEDDVPSIDVPRLLDELDTLTAEENNRVEQQSAAVEQKKADLEKALQDSAPVDQLFDEGTTVTPTPTPTPTYTVTWLDEDGVTELEKDENVAEGATPTYDGATPTKAATAQYSYTFAGWTPAVTAVTADAAYTATYTETVRTYTVTWLDEDGTTELEKDEDVSYGTAPSYDGATPSKGTGYTFAGWTPAVAASVTGDAAYTAQYSYDVAVPTVFGDMVNVTSGQTGAVSGTDTVYTVAPGETFTFTLNTDTPPAGWLVPSVVNAGARFTPEGGADAALTGSEGLFTVTEAGALTSLPGVYRTVTSATVGDLFTNLATYTNVAYDDATAGTIAADGHIASGQTLLITAGSTLNVGTGITVTLDAGGELVNNGDFNVAGTFVNNATSSFHNAGNVGVTGTFTNNGHVENTSNISVEPGGTFENTANGTYENGNGGSFVVSGTFRNSGVMDMQEGEIACFAGCVVENRKTMTLSIDMEVPTGLTFTNTAEGTVTVEADRRLSVEGTFVNEGTLQVDGTLYIPGTLENAAGAAISLSGGSTGTFYGSVTNRGSLTNDGALSTGGAGSVSNYGEIVNNATFTNGAYLYNNGQITNKGEFAASLITNGSVAGHYGPGTITNTGTMIIGSGTTVTNESDGTIENEGVFKMTQEGSSLSTLQNYGTVTTDSEFVVEAEVPASIRIVNGGTITGETGIIAEPAVTYTVTFDPNEEGASVPAKTLTFDKTVCLFPANLPIPTHTGAERWFAGWCKDSACTVPWNDSGEYLTADVTVYAKWVDGCTVTFDANGGEGTMEPMTHGKGLNKILTPSAFTREGYLFAGWSTTAGGSKEYSDSENYTFTADITLYAVWVPET